MITKITDKRIKPEKVSYKLIRKLDFGESFLYKNSIYVKLDDDVEDCDENETCALNLMNGEISYFSLSEECDSISHFELIFKDPS